MTTSPAATALRHVPLVSVSIAFHGPFHVGGGTPAEGLDRVLDRGALLPGTSLKGVLRAEALERLDAPPELVDATFGSEGKGPSPWWWSDATLDSPRIGRAARIRINPETGTTERGFLALGEHVWCREGHFTIEPMVNVTADRPARQEQRLLLRASVRSVSALGGERTRGSGWVTMTDGEAWTSADTDAVLGWWS